MVSLFLYVWQLPQNVLGLLTYLFVKLRGGEGGRVFGTSIYVARARWGGGSVSLGRYVILGSYAGRLTLRHEIGHCYQSALLGPLYLIVVGLPSVTWATMKKYGLFARRSYYCFFTERWADRIAGINRNAT